MACLVIFCIRIGQGEVTIWDIHPCESRGLEVPSGKYVRRTGVTDVIGELELEQSKGCSAPSSFLAIWE